MTKLFTIALIIAGTAACSGSAKESPSAKESENGMDGTWEIVKAEGSMAETNKGTQYTFDGDKLTLKGGGVSTPEHTKMSKDTIIFSMPAYKMEMKYIHKMKGKQMILQVVDSDQTFYLERK